MLNTVHALLVSSTYIEKQQNKTLKATPVIDLLLRAAGKEGSSKLVKLVSTGRY